MSITRTQWLGGLLAITLVLTYLAPSPPLEELGADSQSFTSQPRATEVVETDASEPVLLIRNRDRIGTVGKSVIFDPLPIQKKLDRNNIAPPVAVTQRPTPPIESIPSPSIVVPVAFGRYYYDGQSMIFIFYAGRNRIVREGDRIDEKFEVKRIEETSSTLLYIPTNENVTIPLPRP